MEQTRQFGTFRKDRQTLCDWLNQQGVELAVMESTRVGDQLLGQFGGFPWGNHPTDHIAAEDVEDRIRPVMSPWPVFPEARAS